MQSKRPHYTVVRVLESRVLIGPALGKRTFDAGRDLIPGIYVVIWPLEDTAHLLNALADYRGPFSSWEEAGAWLRRWREASRPNETSREPGGTDRLLRGRPGQRSIL